MRSTFWEMLEGYWWLPCSLAAAGVGFYASVRIAGTSLLEWIGVAIQGFILATGLAMKLRGDDDRIDHWFGFAWRIVVGLLGAGLSGVIAAYGMHLIIQAPLGIVDFAPHWVRISVALILGLALAFAG
jgi:hypothetical protein